MVMEGSPIGVNVMEVRFGGVKVEIIQHLQAAYDECPDFFLQRGVKGVYPAFANSAEMADSVWDIFIGRQKKA